MSSLFTDSVRKLFRSAARSAPFQRYGHKVDPRAGSGIHLCQVPRIFKAMAREAGLPDAVAAGFSDHSARVGAAQDMVAAGIELPVILHAGRWKSTAMVNRYGERLLARRSGAAQLANTLDSTSWNPSSRKVEITTV